MLELEMKTKCFRFFFPIYFCLDIFGMVSTNRCTFFFVNVCLKVCLKIYLHSLVEIHSADFLQFLLVHLPNASNAETFKYSELAQCNPGTSQCLLASAFVKVPGCRPRLLSFTQSQFCAP